MRCFYCQIAIRFYIYAQHFPVLEVTGRSQSTYQDNIIATVQDSYNAKIKELYYHYNYDCLTLSFYYLRKPQIWYHARNELADRMHRQELKTYSFL